MVWGRRSGRGGGEREHEVRQLSEEREAKEAENKGARKVGEERVVAR